MTFCIGSTQNRQIHRNQQWTGRYRDLGRGNECSQAISEDAARCSESRQT